MLIYAGIAGTGAGLHVAHYYLMLYLMYAVSMRATDSFHLILLGGTAAVLVAAVVLAGQGLSLAWSLVVVALAPLVTIVGYEAVGHRHLQDHLSKLRA